MEDEEAFEEKESEMEDSEGFSSAEKQLEDEENTENDVCP